MGRKQKGRGQLAKIFLFSLFITIFSRIQIFLLRESGYLISPCIKFNLISNSLGNSTTYQLNCFIQFSSLKSQEDTKPSIFYCTISQLGKVSISAKVIKFGIHVVTAPSFSKKTHQFRKIRSTLNFQVLHLTDVVWGY